MRRTRHVVLPVKSWQYMGLLLVSLACLTLGHVSRDREGRAGSLAGPELKHTAPHEVDACPNGDPLVSRSSPNIELASPKGFEGTLKRASRSLDHSLRIRERSARDSRREVEKSANIRDLRSRIAEHRNRDTRHVRADQENQRLIKLQNSRSERRSLDRFDDRRSVSSGRRVLETRRVREIQDERYTDPSRLLQRGPAERSTQRISRLDRVRASTSADRRIQSTDRINVEDRNVRNLGIRERRMTDREMRVERSRSDLQRSVERREMNSERQERVRRISSQLPERSSRNRSIRDVNDSRRTRTDERSNVRSDERRNVDRLSQSNLDRQKRSIPSTELRRSKTEFNARHSDIREQNIRSVRSDDNTRSDRLRTRSVDRQEKVVRDRISSRRSKDEFDSQQSVNRLQVRGSERQERLTRGTIEGMRAANRRAAELQIRTSERRETIGVRRTDSRVDDRRSDRALVRDSDRQLRLTRERLGVRRSVVAVDRSYDQKTQNRGTLERREIRTLDRQNSRSERVQQSIRGSRSHSRTRREASWVESLRRVDTISRSSRVPDVDRRQTERLAREDRRSSSQGNRERSRERQFVRIDDNRDKDRTRVDKNYLVTVPYLTNNKIADNQNYELFKQVLVLVLCTVYTASVFQKKNDIVKNTLTEAARFLAW